MTIAIHSVDLVEHVAAHAGVSTELASTALAEVLAGLAGTLDPPAIALLETELPAELVPRMHRAGPPVPIEDRLLAAGIPSGLVRELEASVAHVLGEELSVEALAAVRAAVAPELAAWFADPSPRIVRHTVLRGRHQRPTLADGRPGSMHPLSEARPRR